MRKVGKGVAGEATRFICLAAKVFQKTILKQPEIMSAVDENAKAIRDAGKEETEADKKNRDRKAIESLYKAGVSLLNMLPEGDGFKIFMKDVFTVTRLDKETGEPNSVDVMKQNQIDEC